MNPEIIDSMILAGVIEVSGIHKDTGEFLYSFSPNIDTVAPGFSNHIKGLFHATVMQLWEKGFIDGNMDEPDPVITLADKGLDQEEVNKLESFEKAILDNIKESLSEQ